MFIRAKVIDYISHPNVLNESIINTLMNDNNLKLTNIKSKNLLSDLPRNTIIAQLINENLRILALPFFSSHISLPLKPGEIVWIYKEQNADTGKDDVESIEYFWLSRIHGMNFFEDANYTHDDRKYLKKYENKNTQTQLSLNNEIYLLENNVQYSPATKTQIAQFNDGPVFNTNNNKNINPLTKINTNNFMLNISGKYLIEDIPRYTKNPGDFIIQGSNNTLIKLGTNFAHESTLNENSLIKFNISNSTQNIQSQSGTIDIVAGSSAISKKFLSSTKFTQYQLNGKDYTYNKIYNSNIRNSYNSILNTKNVFENMKDSNYYLGNKNENIAEGDPDFFSDTSRLYISEKSNGDSLINNYNLYTSNNDLKAEKVSVNYNNNRGFIIGKSDEIRLIAREKVFNLDNNSEDLYQQEGGSIRLIKEGNDQNQAYIVLNHEGIVSIDGSKVIIGDSEKVKDNGKSDHVYIGHGAKEPLVLGYFLKNKLENFMNEVCKALVLISKNLDEINTQFNTHTHPYAGVAGNTAPTPALISTNTTIPITSAQKVIEDIQGTVEDENGNYGVIKDINTSPSTIEDSINNITTIKNSLIETLSKLGRTL